ncbi:Prolipoprotein diacylglyceryl transferase [Rubripirellula obstinata]|uniref:Phosphatidylglycerol--prolipoprotein diacylglyceryl transferase n=1 Tax=Rubripirellula obstinata TaxID=406547 RepID=A0A5B1CDQ3_9BACT|nr:prolipoprotein diacylglyceryl transferase [Rubripirellula obstinata]KAA1259248.1 Prolipoprotein diacylglyceryl transferase [Rubripirellula obstinata]
MRRTLLLIPHEIASLPVFGFGWLLIGLLIGLGVRILVAKKRQELSFGQAAKSVIAGEGMMWAIAAAVIMFVLPWVELKNVDGDPVGLAIRGYGMMLLAGVGSAVYLAAFRAKRRGIDPDLIYAMAPWAFIGGIAGARLFYVVQYRDQFFSGSIVESIGNVLRFTEGGLVVYGSFIGGGLAVAYYLYRHRLPVLTFGDVIVPCMFLGVFFGRMGCLMNGCCYGGRCEAGPMAVQFPPEAKVYGDQIASGELLGFKYDAETRMIVEVRPDSLADQAGISVGSRLDELGPDYSTLDQAPRNLPVEDVQSGVYVTVDGRRTRWTPSQLPARALPVRAAQIISSGSSLVLCLALSALSFFRLRTGSVMFIGFAAYAILRFVLEWVRVDEAGQFGTSLSISQWVSVFVMAGSVAGLLWLYYSKERPAIPDAEVAV